MGIETKGSGGVEVGEDVFSKLKLGLGAVGEKDRRNAGVAGGSGGNGVFVVALGGFDGDRESLSPGRDGFWVPAFRMYYKVRGGGGEGGRVKETKTTALVRGLMQVPA